MKKRIALFSAAFFVFYLASIVAGHLPQVVHGRFDLLEDSHTWKEWMEFAGDTAIYFSLALGVYLSLCRYHPGKQYLHLLLSVLAICTICFFCGLFWARLMEGIPLRMSQYFRRCVFPIGGQVFFSIVFYLIRYTQYKEVQQLDLQLLNRQTELSFLRSQIDPHFLFNNLNNIYALVYEGNAHALPAISGLSELLRYMLYDNNQTVALGQEIDNMEKYIALQQLRFERPSCIRVVNSCCDLDLAIPPLLLIPFIENAFKHGKISAEQNWLEVLLHSDQYGLKFCCSNLVGPEPETASSGTGIGISNAKRRLALLYPESHEFEVVENDHWFTIKLQLRYAR